LSGPDFAAGAAAAFLAVEPVAEVLSAQTTLAINIDATIPAKTKKTLLTFITYPLYIYLFF
jgi:hypothetical protein